MILTILNSKGSIATRYIYFVKFPASFKSNFDITLIFTGVPLIFILEDEVRRVTHLDLKLNVRYIHVWACGRKCHFHLDGIDLRYCESLGELTESDFITFCRGGGGGEIIIYRVFSTTIESLAINYLLSHVWKSFTFKCDNYILPLSLLLK